MMVVLLSAILLSCLLAFCHSVMLLRPRRLAFTLNLAGDIYLVPWDPSHPALNLLGLNSLSLARYLINDMFVP